MFLAILVPLAAQENSVSPGSQQPQNSSNSDADLQAKTLRFRIAAATLYELREIAAEYGLSPEGTSEELRARLFTHLGLESAPTSNGDVSMSIERATRAEYFSLENGTKEIRIQGPLEIRFIDSQGTIHKITARYVIYNRDIKVVQAEGDVEYIRESTSRSDTFRGQSIAFNLDDYSGVFVDGSFDMEPSGIDARTLFVHFGSLISHSEEVIALAEGSLTACDAIDPHYILRAKKIWLFSNNDWAAANATLYVGKIPVLWLPYFYYPSKASILHPTVGYRSRAGAFVQTTTYIVGKQGADAPKSSMFSVNKSASNSFGTFISKSAQATEEPGKPQIALVADAYSSLGVFAGLRGSAAQNVPYTLNWLAAAGLSRSVFLESTGYYSPFDAAGGYTSVWNSLDLASFHAPVRIAFDLEASSKKATSGLTWKISIPFYSDPFLEQDFLDRSESYDFFSILGSTSASRISERASLTQKATLSGSWRIGNPDHPFAISLNNIASSMNWRSKYASTSGFDSTQLRLYSVDPQRHFFYPDYLRPVDTSFSMSQTLFKNEYSTVSWTNSSSAYIEDRFYSLAWQKPQDVTFESWYWLLGARSNTGFNASYSFLEPGLTFQVSTALFGQGQERPFLYDERSAPATVHPFRIADYEYTGANWNAGSNIIWTPLQKSDTFGASRIQYSLLGKISRIEYQGLERNGINANPLYKTSWITWDRNAITDHSALAELAAKISNTSNRVSIKVSLPPLLESYTLAASSSAGVGSLGASYTLARATDTSELASTILMGNAIIKPIQNVRLSAGASWDFAMKAPLSLNVDATFWSFYARFLAQKSYGALFKGGTWVQDGSQYFRPTALSMSWKPTLNVRPTLMQTEGIEWYFETKNAFIFNQNLIQYTNASLSTNLGFVIKNSTGLSLEFLVSSLNNSLWRYYTSLLPISGDLDPAPYSRNFFTDIWDSFAVWNTNGLKRTLFKLQELSLGMSVDAHDWILSANIDAKPQLITPASGSPYYQVNISFNIAVTWKDISAIKNTISYVDGSFSQ